MCKPHQPFSAFAIQHAGILASFELERGVKQEKVFHLDAVAGKNCPLLAEPLTLVGRRGCSSAAWI